MILNWFRNTTIQNHFWSTPSKTRCYRMTLSRNKSGEIREHPKYNCSSPENSRRDLYHGASTCAALAHGVVALWVYTSPSCSFLSSNPPFYCTVFFSNYSTGPPTRNHWLRFWGSFFAHQEEMGLKFWLPYNLLYEGRKKHCFRIFAKMKFWASPETRVSHHRAHTTYMHNTTVSFSVYLMTPSYCETWVLL